MNVTELDAAPPSRQPGGLGEPLLPDDICPGTDLTALAAGLEPDSGRVYREAEEYARVFDQLERALHRSYPQHVLFVGERGTGLVMLATELARRIQHGEIPFLARTRVTHYDLRLSPLEEARARLALLLARLRPRSNGLACVDGWLPLLEGARGPERSRFLRAALAGWGGRFLGFCTPRECEDLLGSDAELRETFSAVFVPEPTPETALTLVTRHARELARAFQVTIDATAVRAAVWLTHNYLLSEQLPGKALRVLRDVCQDVDFEHAARGAPERRVTAPATLRTVSRWTGVPEETLQGVAARDDFERGLAEEIVGQEQAVREVAAELGLIKAGLTDRGKPASVMLFIGQTGTGKTEMAKTLARLYSSSRHLRTYTLGNFIEPHSVSGIIGVPPGYVGHEQGGRLVNELNSDPHGVVLLDEADKAHPDVLQPFLNLFDEGWIRDQRGQAARADRAIFILTANVGQRMIADMAKQGRTVEEMTARMKEALSQIRHTKSNRPVFPPELLARIKRVILFQPLDQAAMEGIVRKLVRLMRRAWRDERDKQLDIPDACLTWVAAEAHRLNHKSEGREGGRIVRKLLSDLVDGPIQRAATADPAAYRAAGRVELVLEPAREADGRPAVRVLFQDARGPISEADRPISWRDEPEALHEGGEGP